MGTEWYTKRGKGKNCWVNIQFNSVLRLSKIEVRQVSADDGAFKKMQLSFSNGQAQMIGLSDVDDQWNTATISPPVETTNLRLSAIEYYKLPEN